MIIITHEQQGWAVQVSKSKGHRLESPRGTSSLSTLGWCISLVAHQIDVVENIVVILNIAFSI